MTYTQQARSAGRPTRTSILAAALVLSAAFLGYFGCQLSAASSSSATSPVAAEPLARRPHETLRSAGHGALGVADGVVPDGTTVFDDEFPAIANLDPNLLRAIRRAATDAAGDGVEVYVNSGWRSRNYQEQLLREAVTKYGSQKDAARLVATPGTSAHESGDAVDVGHSDAATWLSQHGASYGLCQVYSNEPWHFELRREAVDHGCPARYADPTHDPRMRR